MYSKIVTLKKSVICMVFLMTMFLSFNGNSVLFINNSFADEQATTDTVSLNQTQKLIFEEAKKASNEDKNTRNSLLMIGAVLALVGVAMFLAFKGDDGEKKQKFARTPKKNF